MPQIQHPLDVNQTQSTTVVLILKNKDAELKVAEGNQAFNSANCPLFNWTIPSTKPPPPPILDQYKNDPSYVIQIMDQRIQDLNNHIDDLVSGYRAYRRGYMEQCLNQ